MFDKGCLCYLAEHLEMYRGNIEAAISAGEKRVVVNTGQMVSMPVSLDYPSVVPARSMPDVRALDIFLIQTANSVVVQVVEDGDRIVGLSRPVTVPSGLIKQQPAAERLRELWMQPTEPAEDRQDVEVQLVAQIAELSNQLDLARKALGVFAHEENWAYRRLLPEEDVARTAAVNALRVRPDLINPEFWTLDILEVTPDGEQQ